MTKCKECSAEYEETMPFGLCEDCQADFDSNDAEYQLERAMYFAELKAEQKPEAK